MQQLISSKLNVISHERNFADNAHNEVSENGGWLVNNITESVGLVQHAWGKSLELDKFGLWYTNTCSVCVHVLSFLRPLRDC